MEINIVSKSGGFDSTKYQNVNSLRQELDDYANGFLKEQEETAGIRFDQLLKDVFELSPDQREARIEEGQGEMDGLFAEQREDLRSQLMREFFPNRLSAEEVDRYLDDFEVAWKGKFDVPSHFATYLLEHSPVKTQSLMEALAPLEIAPTQETTPDPLQTALAAAEAWKNTPNLNAKQQQLVQELISEIQKVIADKGTISDLQTWLSHFWSGVGSDIFFYTDNTGNRPWYGIFEGDVTELFTICGTTPPTFSKMDHFISQADQWVLSSPPDPAASLARDLQNEILKIGPHGDAAAVTQWAQQAVNRNFFPYYIFSDTNSIARFLEITGTNPTLSLTYSEILYQQQHTTSGTADNIMFSEAAAELEKITLNGGSLNDFYNWFDATFKGKNDIYMQRNYPGVSEQAAQTLYTIALKGTAPSRTAMDTAYLNACNWRSISGTDLPLANDLVNKILEEGSAGAPSSITEWAIQLIGSGSSDFFNASAIGQEKFLQLTSSYLGLAYHNANQWLNTATTAPARRLASDLLKEIQSLGAGTMAQLQTWLSQTFTSSKDVYWQYAGITQNDANSLYTICSGQTTNAPAPTYMDNLYAAAATWAFSQTGGDALLAQKLLDAMEPLGSQGTQSTLDQWFKTTFGGMQDIYMQNPEASQSAIDQFYSLAKQPPPPTITTIDEKYISAFAWRASLPPDSADYILANTLVNEYLAVGSAENLIFITHWAVALIESDSSKYFNASEAAQANFIQSTGAEMGATYARAKTWLNTAADAPARELASDLIAKIKGLGPIGTMAELQDWMTQTFTASRDVYWQYVGLSQTDANQFYTICQGQNAPAPTAMDTIYARVTDLMAQYPTGSPDALLVQKLLAEIQPLGSSGSRDTLTAWFQSKFGGAQDIYMQNPEASQSAIEQMYIRADQTTPILTKIDLNYRFAYEWQKTLQQGTPDRALADLLVNQLLTAGSGGDFHSITSWAVNLIESGNLTYDNASAAAQAKFVQFAAAELGATYQQAENWLSRTSLNTPAYRLASDFVQEIKALGPLGTMAELQAWLSQTFTSSQDVYWKYVGLSQDDASQLYAICGQSAPTPTALDTIYAQMTALSSSPLSKADALLAQSVLNEVESLGSSGSPDTLTAWFHSSFGGSQDIYMQNPDASQETIQAIYTRTQQGSPPAITMIDQTYRAAYDWKATLQEGSADFFLADQLTDRLFVEGSGGNFAHITTWAVDLIRSLHSPYELASAASQAKFVQLTASNIGVAYVNAENWLRTAVSPQAHRLATALLNEIGSLIPLGTMAQLQTWLSQTFPTSKDVYWQYVGLSKDEANALYSICSEGKETAPDPTEMDKIYANVAPWAASLSGVDAALAQKLLAEVETLGSQGAKDALKTWVATTFGKEQDIYMQNPDVSPQTINALYSYADAGAPPAITTADAKYKLAFDWRETFTPNNLDYYLANDLVNKIFPIGSKGDFATITAWAQSVVDSNFANYSGITVDAKKKFAEITGTSAPVPSDPFGTITADIQTYVAGREATLSNILSLLHRPYPQTDPQWQALANLCNTQAMKLQSAMAQCRTDEDWRKLGRTFGFTGTAEQIRSAAETRIKDYRSVAGYPAALALFNNVLAEIHTLKGEGAPLSALQTWANAVNLNGYPNLSQADKDEFNKLFR